ncbi:F-box domain, FBD domain, Leucine-rich repeat domain, L domain-like protein [Artemisia annua]|uniref:F-box domain, FBD domain, Leucine-rich repeat domain, L domain-like protein n=1 Tax=Artemisia annua TaxID=35608 RepID=A0A2U1QE03_ARTAN|nr:F-box domain, FBD domain, Leucine-rich repeat domain, L domain-like protein [Artemisia annua]PWA96212.1 F-box domain, FBD domain, Leucine-rich repeat domain, L domain-like protein [Artemisia annua]
MSRRRRGSKSNDFISQMPDDVLVVILSSLPIKEVVVTSCLSSRWRFLWRQVTRLNFEATPDFLLDYDSKWCEYMNQVNNVIHSYNHSIVHDFRIHFNVANYHRAVINEWLQYAVNKKVEFLELNLGDYDESGDYYFPSRLFDTQLNRRPAWNAMFVEILSLKKLVLKKVDVKEAILQEFLTNCPHLETIVIRFSYYLKHIRVGGRALNLKHFEIWSHCVVQSIYLSDFDLLSFTYKGPSIDLRLTNLPKLNEVDMYEGYVGCNPRNVFDQISSCSVSLQALSIKIHDDKNPMNSRNLDSFPMLPNVKKLRLVIGGRKSDCLLELASILNACPNLHTFEIKPVWTSPIISKGKARDATNPIEHLKLVKIMGYYGRKCDLELAKYLMNAAVALKKIVIDPFRYDSELSQTAANFILNEEVARFTTNDQIKSILRPGVELCILEDTH